jgi:hypothetical protein
MKNQIRISTTCSPTVAHIPLVRMHQPSIQIEIQNNIHGERVLYAIRLQRLVNEEHVADFERTKRGCLNRNTRLYSHTPSTYDAWIDCTADGTLVPKNECETTGKQIITLAQGIRGESSIPCFVSDTTLYMDMTSQKSGRTSIAIKTGTRHQKLASPAFLRLVVYCCTASCTTREKTWVFGCINRGRNKDAEMIYNTQIPVLFLTSSYPFNVVLDNQVEIQKYVFRPYLSDADALHRTLLSAKKPSPEDTCSALPTASVHTNPACVSRLSNTPEKTSRPVEPKHKGDTANAHSQHRLVGPIDQKKPMLQKPQTTMRHTLLNAVQRMPTIPVQYMPLKAVPCMPANPVQYMLAECKQYVPPRPKQSKPNETGQSETRAEPLHIPGSIERRVLSGETRRINKDAPYHKKQDKRAETTGSSRRAETQDTQPCDVENKKKPGFLIQDIDVENKKKPGFLIQDIMGI